MGSRPIRLKEILDPATALSRQSQAGITALDPEPAALGHAVVHWCRVARPRCGPKLVYLDWLGRYQRVTRRLAESVTRVARVPPLRHVADNFGLHWGTVKPIDKPDVTIINNIDIAISIKTSLQTTLRFLRGDRP